MRREEKERKRREREEDRNRRDAEMARRKAERDAEEDEKRAKKAAMETRRRIERNEAREKRWAEEARRKELKKEEERRQLEGAFYTLVPIRPRWRGERRSLRTLPGVSLLPGSLAFNPRLRRLSTSTDAFQLHPDVRSYGTALKSGNAKTRGRRPTRSARRAARWRSKRKRSAKSSSPIALA